MLGRMKIKLASVLCLLTLPSVALAADEGCLNSRKLVIEAGDKNECPNEVAEAQAITCESAIKDSKRLYALIKSCHKNPKKTGASTSSRTSAPANTSANGGSSTSTTTATTAAAPANISYEGTGDTECSATAPDGTVIAAFRTDSHTTCGDLLRDRVKTAYCAKVGKGTHKYTKVSSSKHIAGKPTELSVYCK